jgi:hypothetical protein
MAQNQVNSIIATSSGLFGGMSKALFANIVLSTITLQTIFEVAVYASVSAIVGYCIKMTIDIIVTLFNHKG